MIQAVPLSGAVIEIFGGTVIVAQDILRSPVNGFAVQVDNGCSGLEAVILCIAAVLAFPANWRLRLAGAICCTAAILGLNVIRIISLFYLGQFSMEWFEWAHLYAWDVLIMVDGVVALILWARFVTRRDAANPASAASTT